MRMSMRLLLAAFVAACSITAWAQDGSVTNEELLARLNALEAQVNQSSVMDGDMGNVEYVPCPNLQAGATLILARPYFEGSSLVSDTFTNTIVTDADFNYKLSHRLWLEYSSCDDAGARLSFYQFDQSFRGAFTAPVNSYRTAVLNPADGGFNAIFADAGQTMTVVAGLDLDTIDLDFFKRLSFEDIELTFALGTRYAHMGQSLHATDGVGESLEHYINFDGIGPHLTVGSKVPLFGRLSSFGVLGTSILYGTTRQTVVEDGGVVGRRRAREPLGIVDLQTGVEWSEQTDSGRIFAQVLVDASLWANGGNLITDFNSFAMLGYGVSFGYEY